MATPKQPVTNSFDDMSTPDLAYTVDAEFSAPSPAPQSLCIAPPSPVLTQPGPAVMHRGQTDNEHVERRRQEKLQEYVRILAAKKSNGK